MLALSNEPQQLIEMILDRLSQLLGLDCCWVQLLDSRNHDLRLVACRGFTPEMVQAEALVDSARSLSGRVAMGSKVVIANLSRDGRHGLSSFREAGLRSLVAVPIRTYRIHGVIGAGSRARKHFSADVAELLVVIASLVGAALNRADLGKIALADKVGRSSPGEPCNEKPGLHDGGRQGSEVVVLGGNGVSGPVSAGDIGEAGEGAVGTGSDSPLRQPSPEGPGRARETRLEVSEKDDAAEGGPFDYHARRIATFRQSHRRS